MTPKEKPDVEQIAYDKARQYMKQYHSCSQGTLLALQETFGLEDDNVFKAATGFAGGIGGMHDTCGILLGACLALGMAYGRSSATAPGPVVRPKAMQMTRQLYSWFAEEFGSVTCRDIRSPHNPPADAPGPAPAQQKGKARDCEEMAAITARYVAAMLREEMEAEANAGK